MCTAIGIPVATSGGVIAVIKFTLESIVGKDNLKEKGVIEWCQDVSRRHSDNKLHKLENEQKYKELSVQEREPTIAKKLGLKIKRTGKVIEKNDDTVVPLHLDVDSETDKKES